MFKKNWQSLSISVRATMHGSVNVVDVTGVITAGAFERLLLDNAAWLEHCQGCAQLLRLTGATIFAEAEDLLKADTAACATSHRSLEVPTALLIAESDLRAMRAGYTTIMGARGFCRDAFSREDQAQAWVRRQAVIHESLLFLDHHPPPKPIADAHTADASLDHRVGRQTPSQSPARQR